MDREIIHNGNWMQMQRITWMFKRTVHQNIKGWRNHDWNYIWTYIINRHKLCICEHILTWAIRVETQRAQIEMLDCCKESHKFDPIRLQIPSPKPKLTTPEKPRYKPPPKQKLKYHRLDTCLHCLQPMGRCGGMQQAEPFLSSVYE